ncbi:hypothetical protein VCRA2116O29_560016 [Vibrio crassostreae]|nr:hypothetical protein VCRA2116O29_560016 [Vibrio crassostreae]CAK2520340.1 hypothetical protein VCRA2119O48_590013 [Vibrio crassostreae]CAK3859852.1 hypothetical protein VCRA2123O74_530016 [Vibrio crassostreae]CAK4006763.1 hypothetical protein VCRA212O16_660016 [Vibrio crassostreae]
MPRVNCTLICLGIPSQKDRFATLGYSDLMLATQLLTILMFFESEERVWVRNGKLFTTSYPNGLPNDYVTRFFF